MNRRLQHRGSLGFATLLLLASASGAARAQVPPEETPIDFKVAFVGDSSLSPDARAVLEMVEAEGASVLVHLGDFDYRKRPDAWEAMIDATLGRDFPVFAVPGNHDVKKWPEYRANLERRAGRVGATCAGETGVREACTYRGVLFLLSGAGTLGDGHAAFLRDRLAASDAIWRICAWHKNQRAMQVAAKPDATGWDVYESCREGGALVVSGDSHTYSRTHLLSSFRRQVIASTSDELHVGNGASFAVVSGLGGRSIHRQILDEPWFAAVYAKQQRAEYGALFCVFNEGGGRDRARCYFKDIRGRIPDRFSVVRD